MKNRERNCLLKFYVFEEEKEFILKKMEVCKINNMSAYLRKVAIDGKIEINDYSWVRELNYNLNKIGVNINQIAKRVNETGSVYKSDMNDMKLSITLDTLTARILKLSSDSQSGIEPAPFYSWWDATDCRADSTVAPVAHKISPDHRF